MITPKSGSSPATRRDAGRDPRIQCEARVASSGSRWPYKRNVYDLGGQRRHNEPDTFQLDFAKSSAQLVLADRQEDSLPNPSSTHGGSVAGSDSLTLATV